MRSDRLSPTIRCYSWLINLSILALLVLFPEKAVSGTATRFNYATAPSAATTLSVGFTGTFVIAAMDASGNTDTAFTGPVSIGLYDTATTQLSDPAAVIICEGVTYTGQASIPFAAGSVSFTLQFMSGSDSEQLYLDHATVTDNNTYPGSFGNTSGPGFKVRGFSENFYAKDLNDDGFPGMPANPAIYPPNSDLLRISASGMTQTSADGTVNVPYSSSISGSAAYTITGISGGYAYGGAAVVPHLYFKRTNSSSNPAATAQVILVYNATNPLTDFDNPRPAYETVWQGAVSNLSTSSYQVLGSMVSVGGYQPFQPFMNNGQIILRIWSDDSAGNTITMRYLTTASSAANLSYITIPYSSQNSQPVKGFFQGATVLADGSEDTLEYVIKNQYSSGITQVILQIPNSPAPTSLYWTVRGAIISSFGSASVASQASASGPGTIVFSAPSTLAVNASVTLSIPVSVTDATYDAWQFPLVSALTENNISAPTDSLSAFLQTMGIPDTPAPFAAVPANFTASGGAVSLAWGEVTDESANGYVVYRQVYPGGGYSAVVTLTSSAVTGYVDISLANLTDYDYQVVATNAITQSPATTAGPVTPFVNPGPPTGVGALTGGTTVRLSWTAPVSVAGSFPVTGYQVWRDTQASFATAATVAYVGLVTTWDDTTVSAGTTYFYGLSSMDSQFSGGVTGAAHNSYLSTPVVSGFPPGNPPLSAAASFYPGSSPTTIELTWQAPVSNLNAPVNYIIEQSVNGTSPTTLLVASSPTTYEHFGLLPGEFCVYRIAAVDSLPVTTNFSASVTGRVGPSAPVSFVASPSASAITLAWNANPPAESVTGYLVYQGSVTTAVPTTGLTVTGLTQGTDYLFEVAAVDNASVTGPRSSLTTALLPGAPLSFGVTANAAVRSNVDLSWTAPANGGNVTGYNIYRNTTPSIPATPIATPTVTLAFQDTSLSSGDAGTIYYYFLQAQNIGGAGPTTMRGLQIPPNPPATPLAASSEAAIALTWTGNDSSEAVSFYTVYRDAGSGFVSVGRVNSPATVFSDTAANGVSTGVDYGYRLTATNPGGGAAPGGESLASGSVTMGRLPQAPGGFATGISLTAPNSSTVTFTWGAVTQVDPNAMAAVVYENGAAVVTLSASTTLYVNAAATASTTYTYNLAVTNAYGAGATAVTPASRLTYPAAPTLNTITLLPNNVYMSTSWTTAGTGDVTQYRVYRSLNGGTYSLVQTIPAAGLSFPVTFTYPVQYGQEYSFEIGAVNPTGEGMRSNAQTVRTGPSHPTGVAALSGISTSSLGVSLSWHANPTAEGVDTYTVYRSQNVSVLGSYVTMGTTASPVTVYSDTSSLTDRVVYYYLLSASGAGLESYLNTVNAVAVTAFRAPNTPSSPTADPANASVTLTWAAVADTSYPVAGYNLIRTGPSGVTQVNSSPIAPVSFLDTGLTNGVIYSYELQTQDDQGHLSALSAPVSVQPLAPPGAPGNVVAGAGENAIQLSWDTATPGTLPIGGYLIFRREQPSEPTSMIYQAPATAVAYIDTNGGSGLSSLVTYDYWLQAFDSTGVTTGLHIGSSSVTVSLSATGYVNPPSDIIATGSPGAVHLTWTDSFAPGSYPVTGYQLWRATSPGGAYVSIAGPVTAGGPNSYTDTDITNGTRYYYYFVALNTAPQPSIHSVTVTALPAQAPEAPGNLAATDGVSQVSLTWTASNPVDNAPVSAYLVYRAILPGAPVIAATIFSPAVTFTDTGLAAPATCRYSLGVININGTAGTSQSTTVTGYPYIEFAPTGLSPVAGNTAVTLSWTPFGAPSYSVTGFAVLRDILTGGSPATLAATSSPYADTTATPGQLYIYRVQALDDHGHLSAFSAAVTDGPANPPAAPSPLMAFAGASQNLLDWGAAAPATPGGLPVSLYVVTGSNGVSAVLLGTQTWYLDETAVDGVPVTYRVQAIDESGKTTAGVHISPAAGPVSGTSDASNVNPPTGLAATATGPTSIVLTWSRPNDQGRVIDYYSVFRATSLAALYSSPTSIARVDNPALSPATQFVDTGVSADTDYYYMVKAYDVINSGESSNSNHAWARTPRPLRPVPPVTSGVMAFDRNLFKPLEGEDLAIYFILPTAGSVQIDIYNVAGRHVQYLYLGERPAGVQQSVLWDGRDHGGNVVSSGIYLIEIKAPGFHDVKKVAVIK